MRSLLACAVLVTAVAVFTGNAEATPTPTPPPAKSYFLAGDPHVPLAIVDGTAIRGIPECTAATRWGAVGSSWRALDAFGQVVATRTVASAERYDVTDCNELEFSGAPRSDHATLYVSSSSPWRPSPSREWAAPPAERNAFVALAKAKLAATPPPIPRGSSGSSVCPHGLPEALYFDAPVGGALIHHGVFGGPTGYVIATNDTHGWRVITTMVKSAFECHRPVAVFDMNGDGAPEIVLRFDDAPSWNDYVLERTSAGAWRVAAESPGGGTM